MPVSRTGCEKKMFHNTYHVIIIIIMTIYINIYIYILYIYTYIYVTIFIDIYRRISCVSVFYMIFIFIYLYSYLYLYVITPICHFIRHGFPVCVCTCMYFFFVINARMCTNTCSYFRQSLCVPYYRLITYILIKKEITYIYIYIYSNNIHKIYYTCILCL